MIIAVDFDGTCVHHAYPSVGPDVTGCVSVLMELTKLGAKLILWTVRSGEPLQDAVNWFSGRGIPLWGVNENPDQRTWSQSPKCHADLFIDDAAFGCPTVPGIGRKVVDWTAVAKHFRLEGMTE